MKLSTPDNPKKPSPLKLLLMGPPGAGKTTFGLQFPDVHVLDCDQNLDGPIRFLNGKLTFTYDSIRYDDNGQPVNIEDCYNRLIDKLLLFGNDVEYKKRRVIFVDSLSHVNEFLIRHVLAIQGKTKKVGEMESRDWNPFKSYAYNLIVGRLEQAGKAAICSCHESAIYEASDPKNPFQKSIKGYEPYFQGQIGDQIGAFFTDIWRVEKRPASGGKTEIWLQCSKQPKCEMIKNSVGLPNEVDVTKGFSVIEPYLKGRI